MSNLSESVLALQEVQSLLLTLEGSIINFSDDIESADTTDLLQFASDLHSVKSFVSQLFNEVQANVTEHVGNLVIPVDVDGATVEIKSGAPRKTWDHKSLINDISKRLVDSSVDLNTGEVLKTPTAMIREALEFAGISYWKVTKLKELHLDADDYCEVGEAKKSLVIRRNK
jgi:hypothetical protein|tara:strand:- start:20957 stop:21469 length:513 start_codon:yes stop_codon:yes gene_type:complete